MPKKPTRDQLARFLPTLELIKAFEALFDIAGDSGTDISTLQQAITSLATRITTAENEIDTAELSAAVEAGNRAAIAAALDNLAKAVDGLAMAPTPYSDGLTASSGFRWNIRQVSSSYAAAVGDWLDCDATGGDVTITPPSAASSIGGMIAICKSDASSNKVIFNGTTNGAASVDTSVRYTALVLVSNGTEWRLM